MDEFAGKDTDVYCIEIPIQQLAECQNKDKEKKNKRKRNKQKETKYKQIQDFYIKIQFKTSELQKSNKKNKKKQ